MDRSKRKLKKYRDEETPQSKENRDTRESPSKPAKVPKASAVELESSKSSESESSGSLLDFLFQLNTAPRVRKPSGKDEAQYAKSSRSSCSGPVCFDRKIHEGSFRIGKMVSGRGPGPRIMGWWHMKCFFEMKMEDQMGGSSKPLKWKNFNG